MLRVITDGRFGNDDDGSITPGSKFRIKIRQIDCTSSDERIQSLRAPEGCLQYFTERLHDNFFYSFLIQPQFYMYVIVKIPRYLVSFHIHTNLLPAGKPYSHVWQASKVVFIQRYTWHTCTRRNNREPKICYV